MFIRLAVRQVLWSHAAVWHVLRGHKDPRYEHHIPIRQPLVSHGKQDFLKPLKNLLTRSIPAWYFFIARVESPLSLLKWTKMSAYLLNRGINCKIWPSSLVDAGRYNIGCNFLCYLVREVYFSDQLLDNFDTCNLIISKAPPWNFLACSCTKNSTFLEVPGVQSQEAAIDLETTRNVASTEPL